MKKTLPIGKALYPGYALLFLFNNAISHSIYTPNAFQVVHINKESRDQHFYLRPGWFINFNQEKIVQKMSTINTNLINNKSTII